MVITATHGALEAARLTPKVSPSAWMKIEEICRYVVGIWINWYFPAKATPFVTLSLTTPTESMSTGRKSILATELIRL